MTHFSFWVGSLLFPLLLLTINCLARWYARMPQSAAGDLMLLFGAFDGAAILQAPDFVKLSHFLTDPNDLRAWFLVAFVINGVFWWFAVFRIERQMHSEFDRKTGRYIRAPALAMIAYLALSAIAIVGNTAPFTVRSSLW